VNCYGDLKCLDSVQNQFYDAVVNYCNVKPMR